MLDFSLPPGTIDEPTRKDWGQVKRRQSKDRNLRKQAQILDLFCLYYTQYTKQKFGKAEKYIPTSQDIFLCRVLVRLSYTIKDWEKFIRFYFNVVDKIFDVHKSDISFAHFVDNFNKLTNIID